MPLMPAARSKRLAASTKSISHPFQTSIGRLRRKALSASRRRIKLNKQPKEARNTYLQA
jgi:hypothetical protein